MKIIILRSFYLGMICILAACSGGNSTPAPVQDNQPIPAVETTPEQEVPLQPDPAQMQADQAEPGDPDSNGDDGGNDTTSTQTDSDLGPDSPVPTLDTSEVTPESESVEGSIITWDITVPSYTSDALQVSVFWGDQEIPTRWVEGQSWLASAFIPHHVKRPLVITFYDGNGTIVLGRVDTNFIIHPQWTNNWDILAPYFETDRWDDDNDGVSNIDELRAGTDPLLHYLVEQPSVDLSKIPDDLLETLAGFQLDHLGVIVEDLMLGIGQTTKVVWPDSDYYQVQDPEHFSVCDGGSECRLIPGEYKVVNHTTGDSYPLEIQSVNPMENPDATLLPDESYLIEGEHFVTETAPIQRTQYACENGGTVIKELVDAAPIKKEPAGYNYPGKLDRHGYLFNQCRLTLTDGPLPDGTYLIHGTLHTEFRDYYGYGGDHIDRYTYNGFSITGDGGLEYRAQGETVHHYSESSVWTLKRTATISEYFKKMPGYQAGESISEVSYLHDLQFSGTPYFHTYGLTVNGKIKNGLTGGKLTTVTTVAKLDADYRLPEVIAPFSGLIEMRVEDGSLLNVQASPVPDLGEFLDYAFFRNVAFFINLDYTSASGEQSSARQVRHSPPSEKGLACSIVRSDGTRGLECSFQNYWHQVPKIQD